MYRDDHELKLSHAPTMPCTQRARARARIATFLELIKEAIGQGLQRKILRRQLASERGKEAKMGPKVLICAWEQLCGDAKKHNMEGYLY